MNNKKIAILLIAASVLIAVVAGIAFVQYAIAQTNGNINIASQTQLGGSNTGYQYPQQGYYTYGSAQHVSPPGYGIDMGMCGRFW